MSRRRTAALATLAIAAAAPASADAASKFVIRGAGFGHGVGMSQYGAYGFAKKGVGYREILAHYYTDTAIGQAADAPVRVLLQDGVGTARISGARSAHGRSLNPGTTYGVRAGRRAGTVELLSPSGRVLKRVTAPLRVSGGGQPLRLGGGALNGVSDGRYRGAMEFRPSGGGVMAVNALDMQDYVRGVISRESPSSWPLEALKAQAVAARTYALVTTKGGNGWDHYPDTRSQVYGGVSAETPSTDQAVAETDGEVVTYDGRPVATYFFSTSGGRTENVENTSLGNEPLPWLKSVKDPYDKASPKHRWGPYRMTLPRAGAKLSGYVKGRFRGIEVVKRGRSPRIVWADVVGTRGRTRVSGATLRARLGLYDTWAYFTAISSRGKRTRGTQPSDDTGPSTGGATPEGRASGISDRRLAGRVLPARRGSTVVVQRRTGRKWRRVGAAETSRRGFYAFALDSAGVYRVRYRRVSGPRVRVR